MFFTCGKYICYQNFYKSLYIFLFFQMQNTGIVILNTFLFQWFQFINFVMFFTYGKYICYQNFQKILHLFLFSIKIYMYCHSKYIFVLVVSIYKFCYVFYIWNIHLLSQFSQNFIYIPLFPNVKYMHNFLNYVYIICISCAHSR